VYENTHESYNPCGINGINIISTPRLRDSSALEYFDFGGTSMLNYLVFTGDLMAGDELQIFKGTSDCNSGDELGDVFVYDNY
jgi:hypothetical protein